MSPWDTLHKREYDKYSPSFKTDKYVWDTTSNVGANIKENASVVHVQSDRDEAIPQELDREFITGD